jgi:hypothetical protein
MSDIIVADDYLPSALTEAGVPFEMAEFGGSWFAVVKVPLENGQTQIVFCYADIVTMFEDFQLRQIRCPAYSSTDEVPRSVLEFMLKENGDVWFGAWESSISEGEVTLSWSAKVPAFMSPNALARTIQEVGEMANEVAVMMASTKT